MVPHGLIDYFTVSAQIAGSLIGLLFVSISLRYQAILGSSANFSNKALAGAAFTGLFNALTISMWAIIPGTSLGYVAVISGLFCLVHTLRRHLGRLRRTDSSLATLILSVAVYLSQLVEGVWLIARPGSREIVLIVAYTLYGAVATSLRRAWTLLQPGDDSAKEPAGAVPLTHVPGPPGLTENVG